MLISYYCTFQKETPSTTVRITLKLDWAITQIKINGKLKELRLIPWKSVQFKKVHWKKVTAITLAQLFAVSLYSFIQVIYTRTAADNTESQGWSF